MTRRGLVVQNINTGLTSGLSHHCTTCRKPITTACFKKFHVAFCMAPKNPDRPADGLCGFRFNVKSPQGCCKHPYNQGFNEDAKRESMAKKSGSSGESDIEGGDATGEGGGDSDDVSGDAEEEIVRAFDKDWSKLEYKEKAPPRVKTKDRQGKKAVGSSSARK